MLKYVFLSVLAILGIRDLIHFNLIHHLLKSDLGGGKVNPLCCCGFHYFSKSRSEEGKGSS